MKIRTEIGVSPQGFGVVFTSIDQYGAKCELKTYVFTELGLIDKVSLPEESELTKGFALRNFEENLICFIVTVGSESPSRLLEQNLRECINYIHPRWRNGKVWIPLMGIGTGRLQPEKSFDIIYVEVIGLIEKISPPEEVLIALPKGLKQRALKNIESKVLPEMAIDAQLNEETLKLDSRTYWQNSFSGKIYAAGSTWFNIKDQTQRFIVNGIWENGYDEKGGYHEVVKSVQVGDLLVLKSTYAYGKEPQFRVKAFGIVSKNFNDGKKLEVNWAFQTDKIDVPGHLASKRLTIQEISTEDLNEIYKAIEIPIERIEQLLTIYQKVIKSISIKRNYWWFNFGSDTFDQDSFGIGRAPSTIATFPVQLKNGLLEGNKPNAQDKMVCFNVPERQLIHAVEVDSEFTIDPKTKKASIILRAIDGKALPMSLEDLKELEEFKRANISYSSILPQIISRELFELFANGEINEQESKEDILVQNRSTISNFLHDTQKGEDYLGVQKDVEAFAKIMASRLLNPPLAIAIFGKWGSGKSFFMNKLKDRIQSYSLQSVSNENDLYCHGIVQIHFNAWSYLDSNLWAGLAGVIFERLHTYISENTLGEIEKRKVEEKLTKHLEFLKNQRSLLVAEKNGFEKTKLELKSQVLELELRIVDRSKNRLEYILNLNPLLKKEYEKFTNEPIASNSLFWINPRNLLETYKAGKSFLSHISNLKYWHWHLILAGALPIILFLVIRSNFYEILSLKWTGFMAMFPILSVFFMNLSGYFIKLRSLKSYVDSFNQLMDKEGSFHTAVDEARIELNGLDNKLDNLKLEIEKIESTISSTSMEIASNLTYRTLDSFIRERGLGESYRKHLSIVSIVRRDFEILSELFSELNNSDINLTELQLSDEKVMELKSDKKEIAKQFKSNKRLERIIIYVDDLDRCDEERVVQVLEAVNLMMAFPLFVVVVGVDPRWVRNALEKQHASQFINDSNTDFQKRTDPSNYLEKIFQIPFHLKNADDQSIKNMITKLTSSYVIEDDNSESEQWISENDEPISNAAKTKKTSTSKLGYAQYGDSTHTENEYLRLSKEEAELLPKFSVILGDNPRAVKRFVNIYQIVKAHAGLQYQKTNEIGVLMSIMLLLAISIGPYKGLLVKFVDYITNSEKVNSAFFFDARNSIEALKMSDELNSFRTFLDLKIKETELDKELDEIDSREILKQFDFVRRFTFSDIA